MAGLTLTPTQRLSDPAPEIAADLVLPDAAAMLDVARRLDVAEDLADLISTAGSDVAPQPKALARHRLHAWHPGRRRSGRSISTAGPMLNWRSKVRQMATLTCWSPTTRAGRSVWTGAAPIPPIAALSRPRTAAFW